MPIWFYCLEVIYIYVCICMYVCIYIYTICELFAYFIGIYLYACMYICTLMFLILICVCILSSFHPHNHHLSPNSPRLMFLFVDCATVNKVYLIIFLALTHRYIYHDQTRYEEYTLYILSHFKQQWSNAVSLFHYWYSPKNKKQQLPHSLPVRYF